MTDTIFFLLNSVLFGIGLAMDAFSVSMANGLNEPEMPRKKELAIAGTFGAFQFLMPLAGWFLVRTAVTAFRQFERWIPWIALLLLSYIGGKMILEGVRENRGQEEHSGQKEPEHVSSVLTAGTLFLQAVATSIDALSVGFTISEYDFFHALTESLIIGIVTFFICLAGLSIGKKFGMKLSGKASVFGGVILVLIGVEIFITHL